MYSILVCLLTLFIIEFKSTYRLRQSTLVMFLANDMHLQSLPHTFTDDQCLPTMAMPTVHMISVYLQ